MNVNDIKEALHKMYLNFEYELTESYIFRHDWETDFFVRSKSGYAYEIEIKVSRSDYKADFKKPKHNLFKNIGKPFYIEKRGEFQSYVSYGKDENGMMNPIYAPASRINIIDTSKMNCPNKFFYAVPEGLITKDEVPDYAGLIHVNPNKDAVVIKAAPFLHKRKINLNETLLRKFYYECIEHRRIAKLNHYKTTNNEQTTI
jgi:hypothetical protein